MRQPVKQIAYKYTVYILQKLNFRTVYIVHQLTLSLRCKYSRSNFRDAINSTRRSAAIDCKPMTSVFYDVILSPFADALSSNMLIEGHFDGFWGI